MKQDGRKKCDVSLNDLESKNQVYFSKEILYFDYFEYHQEIRIQDVQQVTLSLVSRIYNHSDLLVQKGSSPITLMQGYTKFPSMKYYFDIDILTNNQTILLESNDLIDSIPFIFALTKVVKDINDPLNLLEWIPKYQNNEQSRTKLDNYLTKEFPPLAKKFHLENPRMDKEVLKDTLDN